MEQSLSGKTVILIILAVFAAYFPLAVYFKRSFVDPAPKGKVVVQILRPYELHDNAAVARSKFVYELNDLGDDPHIEGDSHSPVIVYEERKPLGPAHSNFGDISHLGSGRFSHLKDAGIIFSASDNTDPNTNGRNYWAVVPDRQ